MVRFVFYAALPPSNCFLLWKTKSRNGYNNKKNTILSGFCELGNLEN